MIESSVIKRFWSKVDRTDTCWNWKAGKFQCGGYGIFYVNKEFGTQRAHRFSYYLYNGEIEIDKDLCVCHKCDNRVCVNPDHLFLGTRPENLRDAAEKGRMPKGSNHKFAKLTDEDIKVIREASGTMSQRQLAKIYNVHQTAIHLITSGKRWRHI